MKILSVVGARPQFIKLKPISEALAARQTQHIVVHTGQHYDVRMSSGIFNGLSLPEANVNLRVGSDSQAHSHR